MLYLLGLSPILLSTLDDVMECLLDILNLLGSYFYSSSISSINLVILYVGSGSFLSKPLYTLGMLPYKSRSYFLNTLSPCLSITLPLESTRYPYLLTLLPSLSRYHGLPSTALSIGYYLRSLSKLPSTLSSSNVENLKILGGSPSSFKLTTSHTFLPFLSTILPCISTKYPALFTHLPFLSTGFLSTLVFTIISPS